MRFEIEGLADLPKVERGVVDTLFKREMHAVLEDLNDRPNVLDARKITLTVAMKPVANDAGLLDEVRTEFEVKKALPTTRTKQYAMGTSRAKKLIYNDLSEDPRQHTLDELEDERTQNS